MWSRRLTSARGKRGHASKHTHLPGRGSDGGGSPGHPRQPLANSRSSRRSSQERPLTGDGAQNLVAGDGLSLFLWELRKKPLCCPFSRGLGESAHVRPRPPPPDARKCRDGPQTATVARVPKHATASRKTPFTPAPLCSLSPAGGFPHLDRITFSPQEASLCTSSALHANLRPHALATCPPNCLQSTLSHSEESAYVRL